MIEINLLPAEFKEKVKPAKKRIDLDIIPKFIPLSLVGMIALLIILILISTLFASIMHKRLRGYESTLKKERVIAEMAKAYKKELPGLEERLNALEKRVREKIYWWRIFEQISYTCPDEIELTNIKLERDRRTTAPDKLIIEGFYKKGISLEQVFIRNLDANEKLRPYFDHFIVADREPKEGKTSFAIFCHFKEGLL